MKKILLLFLNIYLLFGFKFFTIRTYYEEQNLKNKILNFDKIYRKYFIAYKEISNPYNCLYFYIVKKYDRAASCILLNKNFNNKRFFNDLSIIQNMCIKYNKHAYKKLKECDLYLKIKPIQ